MKARRCSPTAFEKQRKFAALPGRAPGTRSRSRGGAEGAARKRGVSEPPACAPPPLMRSPQSAVKRNSAKVSVSHESPSFVLRVSSPAFRELSEARPRGEGRREGREQRRLPFWWPKHPAGRIGLLLCLIGACAAPGSCLQTWLPVPIWKQPIDFK